MGGSSSTDVADVTTLSQSPGALSDRRSIRVTIASPPGSLSEERPSAVSISFRKTSHELRVRALTPGDHAALQDLADEDTGDCLSPESIPMSPSITSLARSRSGGEPDVERPLRMSLRIFTIAEDPSDPDYSGEWSDRISDVRSFPQARSIRSETQTRSNFAGRSKRRTTVSVMSEDGSTLLREQTLYSSDENDEDYDVTLDDYEFPPSDWSLLDKVASPTSSVSSASSTRRLGTRMKSIAFLHDMSRFAETTGLTTTKGRFTETREIRSKLDSKLRNQLMSERMAQVHFTVVGVIFGEDLRGALPHMELLNPSDLKSSMATMSGKSALKSDVPTSPFFSDVKSDSDEQVLEKPLWSGVYCSGQLIGNQNAPWMHGMVKQLRTPLKKQEIFQSDKLYTHEYDSYDSELLFFDETLVFPVLPFEFNEAEYRERCDTSPISAALAHLHPQIVSECFQDLCASSPGGSLLIKLKQTKHTHHEVATSLESGTRSILRSKKKKTKVEPSSVADKVTGLACAQLTIRDLLANIENVIYKDDKYESDDYLFQVPLHHYIGAHQMKKLRNEMDKAEVVSPLGLLHASKSEEPRHKNLIEREIVKPKACGVLVCQCQFVWD